MMSKPATAADFTRWTDKAATLDVAALRWSADDAGAAARAVDAHDPVAAGRYLDEAGVYRMELARRTA